MPFQHSNACRGCLWTLYGVFGFVVTLPAEEPARPEAQQAREEFFEARIRPLLVKHCRECHGEKKQESGLRLDHRAAFLAGGDSGKVVERGDAEASRLIQVIRYAEDDTQMPPAGKLPEEAIALLTRWVNEGASWPETPQPRETAEPFEQRVQRLRREHWAYRPVTKVDPPAVPSGAAHAIDRFIEAQLAKHGLEPSPPATRATLLRRVHLDLTGLPPTYEQVQAFVDDPDPQAYENAVDRLLASPEFGEHWARHWLDVARYADTKGYVFNTETRYPFAYTYRDWVIKSLNADKPFARFILEQLAADLLPDAESEDLAALGFLTVGRRFRNSTPDIVDDRIDVVTRGLLGMTAACARCHDHKYDPIPTEDYYSLYGVFDSTYEPEELPLLAEPEDSAGYRKYKHELAKREQALRDHVAKHYRALLASLRSRVADYLVRVVKESRRVPDEYAVSLEKDDLRPRIVSRWDRYLKRRAKPNDPVFGPWHESSQFPAESFAAAFEKWLAQQSNDGSPYNPLVLESLAGRKPESFYDVAVAYGRLLSQIERQWRTHKQRDPKATALPDSHREALRQVLYATDSPTYLTEDEAVREFDRVARNRVRSLKSNVQKWQLSSPHAPPRAMLLRDKAQPASPVVFLRGDPARRGERVPRRFPRILAGLESPAYGDQQSGRLTMARQIVDPANPLTHRVFVNRVWMHLFGEPLVSTPSDFGLRSEPPTHPELLDWLAASFVEQGGSLKELIRTIVISRTYRQSSRDDGQGRAIDPANRLLWRQNLRRKTFETLRDSMLAVSGRLDPERFGRPVDIVNPDQTRRSVYGFVDRNNLPSLHRTFDFASPDTSTARRPRTTVPQQALFGLNSPFVRKQSGAVAALPEVANAGDDAARVGALFRRVLARDPADDELSWALALAAAQKNAGSDLWQMLAQALLLTNEFTYIE